MDKRELKQQLDKLKVYPGYYSLQAELLPDRIVLNPYRASLQAVGLSEGVTWA